jgi:subtilase family serine protease
MSILRRLVCAQGRRGRQSLPLAVESLELRLALAASSSTFGSGAMAPPAAVHPTFVKYPLSGTRLSALASGRSGVLPQGWGSSVPYGMTPAEIRGAYGINNNSFPSGIGDGTGQTIAIVDAYDDPAFVDSSALGYLNSDLIRFDQKFGLPNPPSFTKLNEYGDSTNLPFPDPAGPGNPQGNWEVEEALDVEWAHAIAPGAAIILVECNSASGADMYQGVTTAADLPGVSVVSMSWGSGEFSGEQFFDKDFTTPSGHTGVTFVASTGDGGAPGDYPAYSPNVVAVGGTSLYLNGNGTYSLETGWSGSGGGKSGYETEPANQAGVQSTGARTIPDVSFDADPNTGVAVYDSYNGTSAAPWEQIGGTSLAAPSWAGILAIANQGRVSEGATVFSGSSQALSALYTINYGDFNDVVKGSNGGASAHAGYDEVAGLGTPKANFLVPDLAAYGLGTKLALTAQPTGNITAGASFGLVVSVESSSGQLESGFGGRVTLVLSNNPGGSVLGGASSVMAQNGTATFPGLTLNRSGIGYTLVVTVGSASIATSSFNVTPAAPARLVVISEPPSRVVVNQSFGIAVAVEDVFGNLETALTGSVSVALASGPNGSTLGGTLTARCEDGIAVFSGLTLNRIGSGYSIRTTGNSELATGRSSVFNVISAAQKAREQARLFRAALKFKIRKADLRSKRRD